ncbi:hypothetical protein [Candidatus Methanodesulfokora washburnensis]|jgi:uncharacterized Zn finger protein (UPF0148 family)|uniref:hypothetical protein n=1 Tax=Candidatus Methanodesulfokora washburnensis TaxID=2478471 RepID=UPI00192A2F9F|nr:hypothetical protein [Candidatus Methanodesulfokores washburnensis]
MPEITCPVCGFEFYMNESNYEGEIQCPKCKALLEVSIEDDELVEMRVITEGVEEELWEGDEEYWEEEEEEGEEEYWEEEEGYWEEEE